VSNNPIYSVIVPIYCEGSYLGVFTSRVLSILDSLNETYELILIDDGSLDNTWAIIEAISKKSHSVRAVRLSRNFGKEAAISAGLEFARGKAVIVMDGDLQHPPELIPEMIRIWHESDADVVEAIKKGRGKETIINKMSASIFYRLLNILAGYDLNGATDYKLMDRRVLDAWRKMGERSLFFRGMTSWLGFKHVQIPFSVQDRISGQSKWSIFQLIKLATTGVTAFSSFPLHIVTITGICFFIFAIIMAGHTFYMKITGQAVSGFATVILLLLIIGSTVMIGLGIIGEYIARIYEEVKNRPRYIIDNKFNTFSEGNYNKKSGHE
jgi:polyisoprenyl-phosphate glycosyltransferase